MPGQGWGNVLSKNCSLLHPSMLWPPCLTRCPFSILHVLCATLIIINISESLPNVWLFTYIAFNPYHNPARWIRLTLFCRWGSWGSERLRWLICSISGGETGKHSAQPSLTPECKPLTTSPHCLHFQFFGNENTSFQRQGRFLPVCNRTQIMHWVAPPW